MLHHAAKLCLSSHSLSSQFPLIVSPLLSDPLPSSAHAANTGIDASLGLPPFASTYHSNQNPIASLRSLTPLIQAMHSPLHSHSSLLLSSLIASPQPSLPVLTTPSTPLNRRQIKLDAHFMGLFVFPDSTTPITHGVKILCHVLNTLESNNNNCNSCSCILPTMASLGVGARPNTMRRNKTTWGQAGTNTNLQCPPTHTTSTSARGHT
mmetsp:Transcript_14373/g.25095  ORF Transcript_14373/g.25095 Transcript_14373/m.25095 type:complete len:208 (-) Transcript_14373:2108-2731(-)